MQLGHRGEMGPKQRSTAAASALAGTLHDAETRQLEDFIKKRSKALDGDISEMRKRLSKGAPDQLASGGGVFTPASVEAIQISGVGLSTHSQGSASAAIEASSSELDAAAARNRAVFERSQPVQPRAATMKDRLGTFLARIKIRKLLVACMHAQSWALPALLTPPHATPRTPLPTSPQEPTTAT